MPLPPVLLTALVAMPEHGERTSRGLLPDPTGDFCRAAVVDVHEGVAHVDMAAAWLVPDPSPLPTPPPWWRPRHDLERLQPPAPYGSVMEFIETLKAHGFATPEVEAAVAKQCGQEPPQPRPVTLAVRVPLNDAWSVLEAARAAEAQGAQATMALAGAKAAMTDKAAATTYEGATPGSLGNHGPSKTAGGLPNMTREEIQNWVHNNIINTIESAKRIMGHGKMLDILLEESRGVYFIDRKIFKEAREIEISKYPDHLRPSRGRPRKRR
jgi:hypothetical protein